MKKRKAAAVLPGFVIHALVLLALPACSGMKVVNPNDPNAKNAGTKQVDFSTGSPRIVSTYSCNIAAGNGKRVVAIGKTEAEARKEALAKCRGETLVSICREENLRCAPN